MADTNLNQVSVHPLAQSITHFFKDSSSFSVIFCPFHLKYPLCPVPYHNKHFSMLCIAQNEEACCSCIICADMECAYLSEQVRTEMRVCIFIDLEYLALLVLTCNASPASVLILHSNKIFLARNYKLWCVKQNGKSCIHLSCYISILLCNIYLWVCITRIMEGCW